MFSAIIVFVQIALSECMARSGFFPVFMILITDKYKTKPTQSVHKFKELSLLLFARKSTGDKENFSRQIHQNKTKFWQ